MYEVADGSRIQMWQALTTTDRLTVSDIASDWVECEFFFWGERVSLKRQGRMQSNLLATVGSGIIVSLWLALHLVI